LSRHLYLDGAWTILNATHAGRKLLLSSLGQETMKENLMSQDEHAAKWSAVDKLDEIRKLLGIGVQDDVVAKVRELWSYRNSCDLRAMDIRDDKLFDIQSLRDSTIETLEDTRDHLLRRIDRAERALLRAGFTDNGGQEWKPPVNVEMGELYQKCFSLEAEVSRLTELAEREFNNCTTRDVQIERLQLFESSYETIKAEYTKLKAVAEGQDALISELRLTLADCINDKRDERKRLTTERDAAERAAMYFAKRLEYQYHAQEQ